MSQLPIFKRFRIGVFICFHPGNRKKISNSPVFRQSVSQDIDPSAIQSFTHFDCCHSLTLEWKEAGRWGKKKAAMLHDSVVRFNENKLIFAWHLRLIVIHQGSCCCRPGEWLNGKDALFAFRIYMPAQSPLQLNCRCLRCRGIRALAWIYIQLRVRSFTLEEIPRLWFSHSALEMLDWEENVSITWQLTSEAVRR